MSARTPIWRFDGALGSVWLLGVPGVTRPETPWLTQNVLSAITKAHRLLVESTSPTSKEKRIAEQAITEEQGHYSDEGLTAEQSTTLRTFATKAGLGRRYRSIEPAALVYLLEGHLGSQQGLTVRGWPERFIEAVLARRGVKPTGLEPPGTFNLAIATLPASTQDRLLRDFLETPLAHVVALDQIVSTWSSGDVLALEPKLCAENQRWKDVGALQLLVLDRNAHWVKQIVDELAKPGDIIIVVGLGHVYCDGGLLDLFSRQGIVFRPEKVEPITRALAEQYSRSIKPPN